MNVDMGRGKLPEWLVLLKEESFETDDDFFRSLEPDLLVEPLDAAGVEKEIGSIAPGPPSGHALAFAEKCPDRFAYAENLPPTGRMQEVGAPAAHGPRCRPLAGRRDPAHDRIPESPPGDIGVFSEGSALELIHYMNTRGQKILFASDHPVLPFRRCNQEAQVLDLRPGGLEKCLRGNASRLFSSERRPHRCAAPGGC